jgi:hypothetical protein
MLMPAFASMITPISMSFRLRDGFLRPAAAAASLRQFRRRRAISSFLRDIETAGISRLRGRRHFRRQLLSIFERYSADTVTGVMLPRHACFDIRSL